jgi:hypothetical protein
MCRICLSHRLEPLRPALDGANRRVRSLPFGREHRLELLDVGLQRGVVGLKDGDQRGANDIGIGPPFLNLVSVGMKSLRARR